MASRKRLASTLLNGDISIDQCKDGWAIKGGHSLYTIQIIIHVLDWPIEPTFPYSLVGYLLGVMLWSHSLSTYCIFAPFFENSLIFLVNIRSLWLENDHEPTSYWVGLFLVVGQCWPPTDFVLTEFSLCNFTMTPWEAKTKLVNTNWAHGHWDVCLTFALCELLQPHNDLWWHGNDVPWTW